MTERQAAYNAGETEAIKPCPFCGEPENIGLTGLFDTDYVLCYSCHSRGPFSKGKADAVLLWNAAANALDAANMRTGIVMVKNTELRNDLEEAHRIAALRLTDCETMATEADKYKAERDEARAWARKLWREKQAEKQCPACGGDGYVIVDIIGYSNGRMQKCFVCNGTGKVTK